jgi:hypothetical protein
MKSSQIEDVYCTSGCSGGSGQAWVVIAGTAYKIRDKDLLQILKASDVVGLKVTQARVYQYVEVA